MLLATHKDFFIRMYAQNPYFDTDKAPPLGTVFFGHTVYRFHNGFELHRAFPYARCGNRIRRHGCQTRDPKLVGFKPVSPALLTLGHRIRARCKR